MIRLALRVPVEHAEVVLAELLDLAPSGVEEVEGQPGTPTAGTVEYAVYGAPGELPRLPDLRAAAGTALIDVTSSELPDDWGERWMRFHHPVLIEAPVPPGTGSRPRVPSLRVRPPWEPPVDAVDGGPLREIVIDPGQAFGTGAHASTRLCLELIISLASLQPDRGMLIDVGTGSGVLAIASERLGYGPVIAVDHEPESVTAARENAAANGAAVEVRRLDLRLQRLPWPQTDSPSPSAAHPTPRRPAAIVVVANLLRPLLLDLSERLPSAPQQLIAGGLLLDEANEVAAAFARTHGLVERDRREQGEWAAIRLAAGAM